MITRAGSSLCRATSVGLVKATRPARSRDEGGGDPWVSSSECSPGSLIGAAGAVLYSVQTGRDLRKEFEQVRAEVQRRDLDALGKHLEERFKELQVGLEERVAQARETSTKAVDEAAEKAESATT